MNSGSGPIPEGAPRWVTASKDGHLPVFITRWLATPPQEFSFTGSDVWFATHNLGRVPTVTLRDSTGKEFEAEVTATLHDVTVHISEPLTGTMTLR